MNGEPAEAALMYLAVRDDATTSDVAKAVFDPEDDEELRNADRKVRYYFTEKFDHLVTKVGDDPARYEVTDVEAGLGRIEIQTFRADEISIGLGGVVLYPDSDGDTSVSVVGDVDFVQEDS